MSADDLTRIDWRTTLRWLAASLGTGALAACGAEEEQRTAQVVRDVANLGTPGPITDEGYGRYPDTLDPTVTWARTMTTPQLRLTRILDEILDIAVDLRRDSPTFGHHVTVTLSEAAGNQLFVPFGFGHAFCTLEPDVRVSYKVGGGGYAPATERAVRWDDPDLALPWPDFGPDGPVLSDKDSTAPLLSAQPDLF